MIATYRQLNRMRKTLHRLKGGAPPERCPDGSFMPESGNCSGHEAAQEEMSQMSVQEVAAEQDWHSQYIQSVLGGAKPDVDSTARLAIGLAHGNVGGDGHAQKLAKELGVGGGDPNVTGGIKEMLDKVAPDGSNGAAAELLSGVLGNDAGKQVQEALKTGDGRPSGGKEKKPKKEGAGKGGGADALRADAHAKLNEQIKGMDHLPPETKKLYSDSAKKVFDRMPTKAMERFSSSVKSYSFYNNTKELGQSLGKRSPSIARAVAAGGVVGGAFGGKGELHLDGNFAQKQTSDIGKQSTDPAHTYAHEFAHLWTGQRKRSAAARNGSKPGRKKL